MHKFNLLIFLCFQCAVVFASVLETNETPSLFPEKQKAKRAIAQNSISQTLELSPYGNSIAQDLPEPPASEYYLVSIDIGHNHLPETIQTVTNVRKITKIGPIHVILVKTLEARDQVLTFLRAAGYFNYLVEKSYQHGFEVQPNLDRLDQEDLPLDNAYTPIGTGAGVHAYIIDSGILGTHVEFAGRYQQDFVAAGEDSSPCNFHGSWVASVMAGETLGVAPLAIIHDLKVGMTSLGCSFYTSTAIDALAWIYENGTLPGVINLSWQGPGNTVIDSIIGQLFAMGYFIVTAAGNSASSVAPCMNSPARASFALSVGSIDETDQISYFSNYGDCVDIWAIGSDVLGADIISNTSYTIQSGTSISAPLVAGLAAVYFSLFSYTDPSQVKTEFELSSLYGKVKGMPEDVSNNRLASTYVYQSGTTVGTTPSDSIILRMF